MKTAKVRLQYSIELDVSAEYDDEIQDFLYTHTPNGVKDFADRHNIQYKESYNEEIISFSDEKSSKALDLAKLYSRSKECERE